MTHRTTKLILMATLFLGACQAVPKVIPATGTGAIVGTVTARPHADLIDKIKNQDASLSAGYGAAATGGITYFGKMLNYPEIDEIYVGLVGAISPAPAIHDLVATENGLVPRGIALAPGDTLRISNETSESLTFYAAGDEPGQLDEGAPIPPGQTGELTVSSEGTLELGVDERDDLEGVVLSRAGMATRRLKSGAPYTFNNLQPGSYQLIFWYWRLGEMHRTAVIKSGTVLVENEELAVDRLFE